ICGLGDGCCFRNARDVYQERGLGKTKIKHRSQCLASRNDFCIFVAGEDGSSFGHRRRRAVLESGRLHSVAARKELEPRARAMASTIRRGVTGDTRSSAPNPQRASLMALVMAAGGAIAPPSP